MKTRATATGAFFCNPVYCQIVRGQNATLRFAVARLFSGGAFLFFGCFVPSSKYSIRTVRACLALSIYEETLTMQA